MKKFIFTLTLTVVAAAFSGCAYNAKTETPGTQWSHAELHIQDTNGFSASAVIDKYNSKKDVQFSVNPATHSATLGSVMNPSNTLAASQAITAQGNANTSQITASGQAANLIITGLGSAAGSFVGTGANAAATGK